MTTPEELAAEAAKKVQKQADSEEQEDGFKLRRQGESDSHLKGENARLRTQLKEAQEALEMRKRMNAGGLSTPSTRRMGNPNVVSAFRMRVGTLDEEELLGAPLKTVQEEEKLAEAQRVAAKAAEVWASGRRFDKHSLRKLVEFSGENKKLLPAWLYKAERYLTIQGHSSDELGVEIATQFLEGVAGNQRFMAHRVRAERGEEDPITCWAELKTFLLANFKDLGSERSALDAL